MENLNIILHHLESNCSTRSGRPYFIPEVWNTIGYSKYSKDPAREGQISVNPYSFMTACIKEYILPEVSSGDYLKPMGSKDKDGSWDLGKSVIYSMFPRVFTAWDHYREGEICPGTFLKAICLLPYIKELKVDIIYLLPVFKYGNRYKKGELGSPYAIKNFYQLDANLHDDLLGGDPETMVEIEFKAFMEACHILGIKVMIDFVFRTVSRDNDLLAVHPDWFYWVHRQKSQTLAPPVVETQKKLTPVNDRSLKSLYTCKGITEYLKQFTYSPPELDPEKWRQVLAQYHQTRINLLDLIEETYQITTAPGFSNILNDPQPLWSDVTYLRFYRDANPKAKPYLPPEQPPYILQDVACLNLYRGTVPNQELWDYCLEVIPYYQDRYGIDGARIDMGHALPRELSQQIVARVKAGNKDFIFWSEELAPEKSRVAKEDGFHFISGDLWSVYRDIDKPSFSKKLLQTIVRAVLPVTAALETPDTPRLALVHRDRRKIALLVLLNFLMPNVIPFINNGMELLEIQPMNLGLSNDETGRFVLAKEDPMYGKLAFFDNYRLHWLNQGQDWMRRLLTAVLTIRDRFSDLIWERTNLVDGYRHLNNPKLLFFCYYNRETGRNLFFLANKHLSERARVQFKALFPEEVRKGRQRIHWVYEENRLTDSECDFNQKSRLLAPGEVLIGFLE